MPTKEELFEKFVAENPKMGFFGSFNFDDDEQKATIGQMLLDNFNIYREQYTKISELKIIQLAFLRFKQQFYSEHGAVDGVAFNNISSMLKEEEAKAVAEQTGTSTGGASVVFRRQDGFIC